MKNFKLLKNKLNAIKNSIGLSIVILVFTNCTNYIEKVKVPTITISPLYINKPTETYDSLFKSVSYIPLETGKNFLISKISQLYVTNEDIFILDELQSQIMRFSAKGKFQNMIGRKGKGPGEYLHPTYFLVNEMTKEIKVCDRRQKKIMTYNFDGRIINELSTSIYFDSFFEDKNNSYWVFMDNCAGSSKDSEKLNFIKMDSIGKLHEKMFGIQNYNIQSCNLSHISNHKTGNWVSFVLPFHNNIYSFNGIDSILVKYNLNFQEASVPEKELSRISGYDSEDAAKNQKIVFELMDKYTIGCNSFIEINDWIYLDYSYKKYGCGVFYNKKTQSVFNFTKIPYDKNGWGTLFYPLLYGKGTTFYSTVEPSFLKTRLEKSQQLYSKERIKSITDLLYDVKVDSNPLIIKYEL